MTDPSDDSPDPALSTHRRFLLHWPPSNKRQPRAPAVILSPPSLGFYFWPLVLLTFLSVPSVSGRYIDHQGYGAPSTSEQRRTPLLGVMKPVAKRALQSISATSGCNLVPRYDHGIAKRGMSKEHIIEACMIPVLVFLSGVFAGLTLGYFSVDPTQLQVLSVSGTPQQQAYARRILPVRKNSHLLLTTLILGNMIVNEALPVITDGVLGGGIYAVVISTALVVIFAEIIPQSVCSRYGLAIGATMAPVVRVLIWIFFPLAWPIAKLLELILGAHHGVIYRRGELRELIKVHAASNQAGGDLDPDTVTLAQGALDLSQKTAKDAMTPMDKVFLLPIESTLDTDTLDSVVQSGHSRIPVYSQVEISDMTQTQPAAGSTRTKTVKKIIGCVHTKSFVLLNPEHAVPLASISIRPLPVIPFDEPLTNMLNVFQEGRSHMAIVSRRGRVDQEAEHSVSNLSNVSSGSRQCLMRSVPRTGSSIHTVATGSDTDIELGIQTRVRRSSDSAVLPSGFADVNSVAKSCHVESVKRKEATSRQSWFSTVTARPFQFEYAKSSEANIPIENGPDGQPLGIITLEDVLEQLIGEEIYDEFDEHEGKVGDSSSIISREAAMAARQTALGGITQPMAADSKRSLPPVVL